MWTGPIMRWFNKKKVVKWLRILHRDLGYFFVGITMVYVISGIILLSKKQGIDPAYATVHISKQFPPLLKEYEFEEFWQQNMTGFKLNKIISDQDFYKIYVKGGQGKYQLQSGLLTMETYKRRPFVHFINQLHLNQNKNWEVVAYSFAGALLFLALSGLFIVQGKNGFMKRGLWFMLAGVLLIVIFIWL